VSFGAAVAHHYKFTYESSLYFDFLGVRKKRDLQQVWSIRFLLLYFAYELNCFCGLETEIPLSKIAEEL